MKNLIRSGDTIWPIAHFFWGYSLILPIFLFILWLITRDVKVSNFKDFMIKRAPAGVIGGLWALVPDMDHFLEEPFFRNAAWNDVFFLHASFDIVVPETDLFFAAEMLLIFAAVNLFSLAVTVESFKRLNEALFGKEEEEEYEEEEGEEVREKIEEERSMEEGDKEHGEVEHKLPKN